MSFPSIPYSVPHVSPDEMISKSGDYFKWIEQRRTVRDFSDRNVPAEVLENCMCSASIAPSGAFYLISAK